MTLVAFAMLLSLDASALPCLPTGSWHPAARASALNEQGRELWLSRKLESSERAYQCALAIQLADPLANRLALAVTLNNLGTLYVSAGRYREARNRLEESARLRVEAAGQAGLDLAATYYNLASLHRLESHMEDAERYYRDALDLREKVLGPKDASLALPLDGLALVYQHQGRLDEAESAARRTLDLARPPSGVARSHTILGLILVRQTRYVSASGHFEKALQILKASGAPEKDFAEIHLNIGLLHRRQDQFEIAEQHSRRAAEILERTLGRKNLITAVAWNNLGQALIGQRRWAEARALLTSALSVWQQVLGPGHPDVASGLRHLAQTFEGQKKFDEARSLLEQALLIDQARFGSPHSRVAADWSELGKLCLRQKKWGDARRHLELAFAMEQQAPVPPGSESSETARYLARLAVYQKRFGDAARLYEEAVSHLERMAGRDNPKLAALLDEYAFVQRRVENYAGAESASVRAMGIRVKQALRASGSRALEKTPLSLRD